MSHKRIVIVDDDQFVCQSFSILLSDVAEVQCFNSIESAKEYIQKSQDINLFILDYNIGNDNGIKFFQNDIKPSYPDIPAFLVSGFIVTQLKSEEELQELRNDFVNIYEKPFDFMLIKEEVKKIFN